MAATIICVPRVSSTCLLSPWRVLQGQQVGQTQVPFRLLLMHWFLEPVWFSMHHFMSWVSISYGSPVCKPHWPSKSDIRLPNAGARYGAQIPFSLRRSSAVVIIFPFVGHLPRDVGLDCTGSLLLQSTLLWFLIHLLSEKTKVWVQFYLSSKIILC